MRRRQYQPYAVELQRIFPALRDLFPNLPEPADADSEGGQFRLYDALSSFLRAVATETPLVVVLDDLHWADSATLAMLTHLTRELGRARMLVLGTYRDTDLDRRHPLSTGARRPQPRGPVHAHPAARAHARRDRGVHPPHRRRHARARAGAAHPRGDRGQPVLPRGGREPDGRGGHALGAAGRRADPRGRAPGAGPPPRPALRGGQRAAHDARRRRPRVRPRAGARALAARRRRRRCGWSRRRCARACSRRPASPGRYRFRHALMQQTLLEELSAARRVLLHGQIAEALLATYGADDRDHLPELAEHYAESAVLNPAHARLAASTLRRAAEVGRGRARLGRGGAAVRALPRPGDRRARSPRRGRGAAVAGAGAGAVREREHATGVGGVRPCGGVAGGDAGRARSRAAMRIALTAGRPYSRPRCHSGSGSRRARRTTSVARGVSDAGGAGASRTSSPEGDEVGSAGERDGASAGAGRPARPRFCWRSAQPARAPWIAATTTRPLLAGYEALRPLAAAPAERCHALLDRLSLSAHAQRATLTASPRASARSGSALRAAGNAQVADASKRLARAISGGARGRLRSPRSSSKLPPGPLLDMLRAEVGARGRGRHCERERPFPSPTIRSSGARRTASDCLALRCRVLLRRMTVGGAGSVRDVARRFYDVATRRTSSASTSPWRASTTRLHAG